jgi:hypothetical protein
MDMFSELTGYNSWVSLSKLNILPSNEMTIDLSGPITDATIENLQRMNVSKLRYVVRDEDITPTRVIDFSALSSLHSLEIQGKCPCQVKLPNNLVELKASLLIKGSFINVAELTSLRFAEYSLNGENFQLPPNAVTIRITQIGANKDKDLLRKIMDLRVSPSVTDFAFPVTPKIWENNLGITHSLKKLKLTSSMDDPLNPPLSYFSNLTSLSHIDIDPQQYHELGKLRLQSLYLFPVDCSKLSPHLPNTLTDLTLVGNGSLVLPDDKFPGLTNLSVFSFWPVDVMITVPPSVTSLKLSCASAVVLFSKSCHLEELVLGDSLPSTFSTGRRPSQLKGLTPVTLNSLKSLSYYYREGFLEFIRLWGSSFFQTLERLSFADQVSESTTAVEAVSSFPNLVSLTIPDFVIKTSDRPMRWPERLHELHVYSIPLYMLPQDLSHFSLMVRKWTAAEGHKDMNLPDSYVFTADVWRNLVHDEALLSELYKICSVRQKEQLEAIKRIDSINIGSRISPPNPLVSTVSDG